MIILWPLMGGCHGATASRYKNLVPEKHAKGLHHLNQMILFFCLEYIAWILSTQIHMLKMCT